MRKTSTDCRDGTDFGSGLAGARYRAVARTAVVSDATDSHNANGRIGCFLTRVAAASEERRQKWRRGTQRACATFGGLFHGDAEARCYVAGGLFALSSHCLAEAGRDVEYSGRGFGRNAAAEGRLGRVLHE